MKRRSSRITNSKRSSMKEILCLLIYANILLLQGNGLAETKSGSAGAHDFSSAKKMKDASFLVEGGEIEIRGGAWRFSYKKGNEYGYICKFTIINNSNKTYSVCPAPFLYDRNGFELNAPHGLFLDSNPFKAKVMEPGESYEFKGSFEVLKAVAVKVYALSIKLVPDKQK
ncbi:hypothetical protein ACFL0P_01720 [Candidatus Omnitrophota bacterium]